MGLQQACQGDRLTDNETLKNHFLPGDKKMFRNLLKGAVLAVVCATTMFTLGDDASAQWRRRFRNYSNYTYSYPSTSGYYSGYGNYYSPGYSNYYTTPGYSTYYTNPGYGYTSGYSTYSTPGYNSYYGGNYYGNGYNAYGSGYTPYTTGYAPYSGYGYSSSQMQGANVGASIGGAIGGNQGANVGAAIGAAVGAR
jgi:hypothetical protein